jgi:DNA-binding NarL/FixJ family response regulator
MGIRVVLADDHRLVRDGLRALLQRESDFELVGQAEEGLAAIRLARELRPDVIVMDVSMPGMNGIEAVHRIVAEQAGIKVLCLSVHDEPKMVLAGLEAGAAGYVLKDCSSEELSGAIRTVMTQQIYLSPQLVGLVVKAYRGRDAAMAAGPFTQLTSRERELVQLFSEGYSTNQIAERLHVSAKTVATHREHILQKLQIQGIAELTRYALREGLSSLEVSGRAVRRA